MPFEAFDKKIEEAAAHHHPVYDEQAWNKMKLLLDKHLPEKKEKKRRFLWIWFLLFFLAAGGGSVWMMLDHRSMANQHEIAGSNSGAKENSSPKNNNNTVADEQRADNTDRTNTSNTADKGSVIQQNNETPAIANDNENVVAGKNNETGTAANVIKENTATKNKTDRTATSVPAASSSSKNRSVKNSVTSSKNKEGLSMNDDGNYNDRSANIPSYKNKKSKNKITRLSSSGSGRPAKPVSSDMSLKNKKQDEADMLIDVALRDIRKDEKDETAVKENEISSNNIENKISRANSDKPDSASTVNKEVAEKTNTKIPRKKKSFSNSFGLSISAGPDVSAVGLSQVGSTRIVYGAGLSYQFARKWNIRTGIYTTSKVYHAKPSDYDPPSYFWNYYPSLEKINANCRVYEIPVIISYIIDQQKKHSWFASAGLSSVIMKRETYDYISKTSTGYETRSYTINDQNKHWMAEARLSFGYQRHFGNSSFTIEPYINAPLKGVGYGKVKLSGAGILFSVSIKPFAKK